MLLVIMETLINLSINCYQDDITSSAPAALAYIVMNLPKLVIFDNDLRNDVFIAAAIGSLMKFIIKWC